MNNKSVIITGATGMIGSSLIKLLVDAGYHINAIVRPNSAKLSNIVSSDNVEIIECDVNNLAQLESKGLRGDIFYHFGWDGVFGDDRSNVIKQESNVHNTLSALALAASSGCKKFIIAGSQAEYGLQTTPLSCSTIAMPITPYGIAKKAAFELGCIYGKQLGVQVCSGRILSAYGIGDNHYTMVMNLLSNLMAGKTCDLTSGEQIWDYIYSEDVARAFLMIGERGVDGKAYPVGSGNGRPLKEYINIIYDKVGNSSAKLNFGAIKLGDTAIKHLVADISELTADTGFLPQHTFSDGIVKTIEWIKATN